MKRFYKKAEVSPRDGGYAVLLDGKPINTPAGRRLMTQAAALAAAVAAEWLAQGEEILPQTMPLTRLAGTAIDKVSIARDAVVDEMVRYAGTDLLCYRAESPRELAARQAAMWQPVLDWAEDEFGAELRVTRGMMPVEQPPLSLHALRRAIAELDDLRLTALADLVPALGSLVLGLAVACGWMDAESAFDASQLDELWEEEQWGEDSEATKRRENLRADVLAGGRLLLLCDGD